MPSPMMTQYHELKQKYPNDILFFRLGDFYEMFEDDAKIGSRVLDLVLTRRKNKTDGDIPMCGVPFHSAEGYISQLVSQGYSVAMCEQVEAASDTKGLVARDVVRVVTPGTVMIDSALDQTAPTYIASVYQTKSQTVIALADISSGDFQAGYVDPEDIMNVLQLFSVKEVVLPNSSEEWQERSQRYSLKLVTESKWSYSYERARTLLCEHFNVASLEGFGFEVDDLRVSVAGGLLAYLKYTQHADLVHVSSIRLLTRREGMILDVNTVENLELFQPNRVTRKSKSLFDVINGAQNPMGARLLRSWMIAPLTHVEEIQARQNDAEFLKTQPEKLAAMRDLLSRIPDAERTLSRLSAQVGGPRDLSVIRTVLTELESIGTLFPDGIASQIQARLQKIQSLHTELTRGLIDQPPVLARDGGFVASNYRTDIDELLELSRGGKEWLISVEARERHETGISNLKIRYNKVFGYYIEVSKSHLAKVPGSYIKKQTLVNAERFITEELKEFEDKILASEEILLRKEQELFHDWVQLVLESVEDLQYLIKTLAYWDVVAGFAYTAIQNNYVLPILNTGTTLTIQDGRHPVVEELVQAEYIPNDTIFDAEHGRFMLITGPNMAGKSTYIRQVALIVLMAQIGAYVPASYAEIGICDRIFTRVGASDNLSEGQSTFMVEMVEVANILRNATEKSLIILDEVGRGTSTYDGMSIARAISEHIHDHIQARTLFATHYHELLSLESELAEITNYRVLVEESEGTVTFLRKIERGGIDKSYGISIAQLAGFPQSVIDTARQTLKGYESESGKQQPSLFERSSPSKIQDNTWKNRYTQLRQEICSKPALEVSPLEASAFLHDIQTDLTSESDDS